ncbi:hypothetical protein Agub_g1799 [Astrephomene gubernaculifera]|uniref:Protein kinase domain-containing protein n=1 Tax=Astrephomene gubernaculifera TaxID=47775 RepID=A0AAD3HHA3_9CHLO|nr:hypothetical protein Agub_g1799 [Astrephomene gubernaculifera]
MKAAIKRFFVKDNRPEACNTSQPAVCMKTALPPSDETSTHSSTRASCSPFPLEAANGQKTTVSHEPLYAHPPSGSIGRSPTCVDEAAPIIWGDSLQRASRGAPTETTFATSLANESTGPSSTWREKRTAQQRSSVDLTMVNLPAVGHLAESEWTRALTGNIKQLAQVQGALCGHAASMPNSPFASQVGGRPSLIFQARRQSFVLGCAASSDVSPGHSNKSSGSHLRTQRGNNGLLLLASVGGDETDADLSSATGTAAASSGLLPCVVPPALLAEAAKTGVSLQVDLETEVQLDPELPPLGRGVSGSVFRGTYKGQECAVKILPPDLLLSSGSAELHTFVQEMVVLASVRHPNIVTFLGGSLQPPHVFLVEELCATSLDAWLHRGALGGAMSAWQRLRVALDVATGLEYLHERQPAIVHRDLKPANILIDASGTAKISDFGLARVKTHAVINTKAPEVGSIGYMAPECFTAEDGLLTDKCDTWSLGVVLWEMVTRKRPWPGLTLPQYYREVVLRKSRLPIPQDDCVCPLALRRLISSCWSDAPGERPSCAHIVQELSRLLKYTPRE